MKKVIRINESALRDMISKSVKKILKEEIDYRSVSDWNDDLSNTDNLYDYDETLGNAKENLRMQGASARLHHPATTPWANDDPNDLSSMDSVDLLYAKPDELERIADKRKTKVYPSGLEESIHSIVKESLNKVITESNALGKVQKFEKIALESLKNIAQSLGLEMQDMGIYPNNGENNCYEFWDTTDETVMLSVKFEHY